MTPDHASRRTVVRDHLTGRLFESYTALHRWRALHGLRDASSSSIRLEHVIGKPVYGPDAPAPDPSEVSA